MQACSRTQSQIGQRVTKWNSSKVIFGGPGHEAEVVFFGLADTIGKTSEVLSPTTDVHAGPAAHMLQPLPDLDLLGAVVVGALAGESSPPPLRPLRALTEYADAARITVGTARWVSEAGIGPGAHWQSELVRHVISAARAMGAGA